LPKPFSRQPQVTSLIANMLLKPVSLRVKLLVGFSLVFSLVFAGAFYWFYTYTTEKVIARLRTDMRSTLTGAIAGVDVEELMSLYAEGKPNAQGFSDDPRYLNQLAWFSTVHSLEPRVWLYSYAVGDAIPKRRIGPSAVAPGEPEIIYLVDLWSLYDPAKAAKFLQSDKAGIAARRVLKEGQLYETEKIYTDEWGTWLSAFAPLRNSRNEIVAILGLDIEAGYVHQLQEAIRNRVFISFIATYSVFFLLIYVLSGILTRRLRELTQSAKQISAGGYAVDLSFSKPSNFPDEMNTLADVFQTMVDSIRVREQLIRDSKRTEDEMRLALQEERELNELKSRFVAMVSHELRTPLTVVRTSLELLERYGHMAPEAKRQEYYQRSRASLETMNQLIEDVLVLGKAEAGKMIFNPEPLNLVQFCQNLVDEMRLSIHGSHPIAFHVGEAYGEAFLDPKLLRSILTNLLSNAVKYSPAGSLIEFMLTCSDRWIVFEISDHGIGIPQDDQPRLFELFHRASNVNTIRGTGLGLAIVRQCVAQHMGEITFTSQEGLGTTFVVKLPLRKATVPTVVPSEI
jgi:signal transduction histidine kinase